MKLRILAASAAAATLTALAGCDRAEQRDRVAAPSPAAPPQSAPSMPSQSPSAAAPPVAPGGDRTAGQTVDDAGITSKVKAALVAEKGVNGTSINVDTRQGNVTLTGKVPDRSQVERATQVARGVEGVKNVDNKLSVGSG